MEGWMLILPILIPAVLAGFILILPKKGILLIGIITITAVTINLCIAILFFGKNLIFNVPWVSIGKFKIDFFLKLYQFSSFILIASAGFAFLISMYALSSMKGKDYLKQFFSFLLITLAMVNGAVLANNLVLMFFFWEGLLITLFAMILTGGKNSFKTAVKALVLDGVADLCLMLGIGIVWFLTDHQLTMDVISSNPVATNTLLGGMAFILMMTGAVAKAGSMPFHSWIPDAAIDAPLPFMAFLPASLEKLLGIYFLARICLNLFALKVGSSMSIVLMTVGSATIFLAVMMALIQSDYKRLLSYHAISQVGYMILGIGTCIPVGIVGGIFHMINHAMYKSGLFLTGGSVEKQAGSTNLKELGGLGRKMPVTFTCFIITAAAISGVPPLNGFFSKELVYDGALQTGYPVFYVLAILGALLTAASFLKLGHAAYLGKPNKDISNVKDPSWAMTIPMIVIALGCILFGVYNPLPLNYLIQPILGSRIEHSFAGFPHDYTLVAISLGVLVLALLNHLFGVSRTKSGLGASDHIHYAPVLKTIYGWAEKRYFDPYDIGMILVKGGSKIAWWIDRANDWIYNVLFVRITEFFSLGIRKSHTGSHRLYLVWSLLGMILVAVLYVIQLK